MAFTGNEDQTISLTDAAPMTKRYRDSLPPTGGTLGHYISKSTIEEILAQENCVGLRVYYAIDSDNKKQLVFVGVKTNEDDLYLGVLGDRTYLCPSQCSVANPLNADIPVYFF